MYTPKISDMFKAFSKTWFGWISILLLVILVGGCVWAFSTGNIVLGVLLAVATIACFIALVYLLYYVFILALIVGTFLSVIFGGLFR